MHAPQIELEFPFGYRRAGESFVGAEFFGQIRAFGHRCKVDGLENILVQLLCLGIIGEYLGKVYTEVKRRPPYIVAEALQSENPHES